MENASNNNKKDIKFFLKHNLSCLELSYSNTEWKRGFQVTPQPQMPKLLEKASKSFMRHHKGQVRDQTREEQNINDRSLLCVGRNWRYKL